MASFALGLMSVSAVLIVVLAGDLCKEREWFNDRTGQCQPCKVCEKKSWELAPCLEFEDTMCVDLSVIDLKLDVGMQHSNGRWHEMEGGEQKFTPVRDVTTSKSFRDLENMWGQVMLVALCISFVSVAVVVVFLGVVYLRRHNENRKSRNRLFSRDRLNTTEFMNNLATLDRRMAIDEILEKRRRAVFEPQLLSENAYTDDVFVDISGLPPHGEHEYEELDHNKCLLQIKSQP